MTEKDQRDKELQKLKSDYELWRDRVGQMSSEFKKTFAIRMEELSMMLLRIIAYNELPMEEYQKEYKDIDPEDEMGHLMKMAHALLEVRFSDSHKYLVLLEGFFSKVRGKILKVQKGGKVVYTSTIDEVDAKSLSDAADKIDEFEEEAAMNPLDDLSQINFVPKALPEDTTPDAKPKSKREDKDGMFVASTDEESFGSDFYDTREEAILSYPEDMGLDEGDLYFVAETVKFNPTVNADRVIENAYEEASEEVGEAAEGWLDKIKREEEALLEDMLNDAFKRWLVQTDHTPRFYGCKNVTEHRAPPPPSPPQLDMFEKRPVAPGRVSLDLDIGPDDRFEL